MYLGVCFGPMGAGKSTYLYDRYRAHSKKGDRILGVTHPYDTRYQEGDAPTICTHSMARVPAIKVDHLMDVDTEGYDVILVDEGQFYPDLRDFIMANVGRDITLYVAGLDGDATQGRFGQVLDIIPMASEKVPKYSICDICGGQASFSIRRQSHSHRDGTQCDPGGFDKYLTVCHKHLCP